MKPITVAQTGVGTSDPIPMDIHKNPFNVGIGVVVDGVVTYSVQYSFDGTNYFDHPDLDDDTTNADGNIAFPVLHVRLNVTAGAGTATMTVIQAGSGV